MYKQTEEERDGQSRQTGWCMNLATNEQTNREVGLMDKQTDEETYSHIKEQTGRRTERRPDAWTKPQIGETDRPTEGQTDERMKQMNRQNDVKAYAFKNKRTVRQKCIQADEHTD
jgi:hypothetical protein